MTLPTFKHSSYYLGSCRYCKHENMHINQYPCDRCNHMTSDHFDFDMWEPKTRRNNMHIERIVECNIFGCDTEIHFCDYYTSIWIGENRYELPGEATLIQIEDTIVKHVRKEE